MTRRQRRHTGAVLLAAVTFITGSIHVTADGHAMKESILRHLTPLDASIYWDPSPLFEQILQQQAIIGAGARALRNSSTEAAVRESEALRRLFDRASVTGVGDFLQFLCEEGLLSGDADPCADTALFVKTQGLDKDVSVYLQEGWGGVPAHVSSADAPLPRSDHICGQGSISTALCDSLARHVTISRLCDLHMALPALERDAEQGSSSSAAWLGPLLRHMCEASSSGADLPLRLEMRSPGHDNRVYSKHVIPVAIRATFRPDLSEELRQAYSDRCSFVLSLSEQATGQVTVPITDVLENATNRMSYSAYEIPVEMGAGRPMMHRCDGAGARVCLLDAMRLPGKRTLVVRTECRVGQGGDDPVMVLMETRTPVFITGAAEYYMGATKAGTAVTLPPLSLVFQDMKTGATETVNVSTTTAYELSREKGAATARWLCQESRVKGQNQEEAQACIELAMVVLKEQVSERYHSHVSGMLDHLADEKYPGFPLEGHTCMCVEKERSIRALVNRIDQEISRSKGRGALLCEVGFNAGHSSLNMLLSSSPETKVISFDLGGHPYTGHSNHYLQDLFPGRLELVLGDSARSIPTFHSLHPETRCDFILIDGGHSTDQVILDIQNLAALAADGAVVVLDDSEDGDVKRAIADMIQEGVLEGDQAVMHEEIGVCNSQFFYKRKVKEDDEEGWHAEAHTFGSGMVITTYLSGATEQARARLTNRRTGL